MKETIKASIGGYAFTLDADAYQMLKSYIDNLKNHFANKEDGNEIIADIEARMCELLQMKLSKTGHIITFDDAKSIIDMMGNPADFEEEDNRPNGETSTPESESASIAKKLYRDTESSILGGVCAGLAKYFHTDVVFVRIVYVASIALAELVTNKLGGYLFLAYFLLWIIMPRAKTLTQKLAMSGVDPSIEAIENRTARIVHRRESPVGKALGSFLRAATAIILILMGIVWALSGAFALAFPSALDIPSIGEMLTIFGLQSNNLNLAMGIVWFLPAACLIYLGVIICTKITRKDFFIFGISVLIWIIACAYITNISVGYAKNYKANAELTDKVPVLTTSDTLYVELSKDLQEAYRVSSSDPKIFALDGETRAWFFFPRIRVNQDTIYKEFEIEVKKMAFATHQQAATNKAKAAKIEYSIQDSLVTFSPRLYNKNNPWDREIFRIEINCPPNKTVKIIEPLTQLSNNCNSDDTCMDINID